MWGAALDRTTADQADALADELADLLLCADAGDAAAETELARRYADDARLHPGAGVRPVSPLGRQGWTDLTTRATVWDGQA